MSKTLKLAIAAAPSGLISGATVLSIAFVQYMLPGLCFGIATAVVLVWAYKLSFPRALFWTGASVVSWYLALQAYLYVSNFVKIELLSMIAAGLIGGLLLACGFYAIVRRDSSSIIPITTVMGGLAA